MIIKILNICWKTGTNTNYCLWLTLIFPRKKSITFLKSVKLYLDEYICVTKSPFLKYSERYNSENLKTESSLI